MTDSTVEPPYSRLFILCSKTISEEDLKDAFSKYGSIEDIWIVKDKTTNENKGVVYIKFNKTSEAALAMEELNGKMMPSSQKPLKIMVAHSREQGSRRDDDSERLLRLFIVVPRNATEDEIRDHFKQFGDVDYVSIVRNRETGESKGFAYVKYTKPVGAARAFEECSRTYKAVYARPKEQKPTHQSQYEAVGSGVERFYSGGAGGGPQPLLGGGDKWGGGGEGGGSTRLTALVSPNLREQHIFRLFDLIPGLQLCRPIHERSYNGGMQKILLQYSSPQFAQHAFEKLNGFEYPIGHRITVKMEPPQPMSLMDGPGDRSG
ncbi:hypothetical protein AAG570_005103 [Ranatra chinensis]|uniref:RRM domain-containing protein n=1 Tax=Ranatra chinensis TaxID=642074 RepID=A0ABD0XZI2_9HEMI